MDAYEVKVNIDIFKYQEKIKLISQFQRFFSFFKAYESLLHSNKIIELREFGDLQNLPYRNEVNSNNPLKYEKISGIERLVLPFPDTSKYLCLLLLHKHPSIH